MVRSAKGTLDAPGKKVKQKSGLNKSILNSAWGRVDEFLAYKALRAGKLTIKVPPHFTSQQCSVCGFTHKDNRLKQSVFICQQCGFTENADFNAAINIAAKGIDMILSGDRKTKPKKGCSITKKVGVGYSKPVETPKLVETIVSRGRVKNTNTHRSVKRETPTKTLPNV
ncbi:putative transposase DNA-binding domain protein [Mariprofundus micogutta]|uniref:Putative transposase DNA-binding domain protein n=1 Tax=Mariprofundus micogutta TaxID=1921010 RepID=A0A1L8CLM5_9PROT|nr:RNA-guided endonuclease TnpB family protein [Mariprofundus micogutta]GAV19801.1 putative transposase DNA-binding domain protein [Mariprofundus micogutta]